MKKIILAIVAMLAAWLPSFAGTEVYTSNASGNWTTDAIWTRTGGAPLMSSLLNAGTKTYTFGNITEIHITPGHVVTLGSIANPYTIVGNNKLDIFVHSGGGNGVLIIYGDIVSNNKFTLIADAGTTVIIHGSVTTQNTAEFVFEGNVAIDGNIDVKNNSTLTVNGVLTTTDILGDPMPSNNDVFGTGTINYRFSSGWDWSGFTGNRNPLPVSLTSFKAAGNTLSWATASETNNEGFELYRSANGQDWEKIGFVFGAGTTSIASSYEFTDEAAPAGLSYYKLVQIDQNGAGSESWILSNRIKNSGNRSIKLIVSSNGQIVSSHDSGLERGIYFVKHDDGSTKTIVAE